MDKTETRMKIKQKLNPIKQQDNYQFYLKLQKKLMENQDKGAHLFNNAYIVRSKIYNHDLIYDPKNEGLNLTNQKNMYQVNQNTFLEPYNNYQSYLHQIQLNKINEKKRILQHQFIQKQKLERQMHQEKSEENINDIKFDYQKQNQITQDPISVKIQDLRQRSPLQNQSLNRSQQNQQKKNQQIQQNSQKKNKNADAFQIVKMHKNKNRYQSCNDSNQNRNSQNIGFKNNKGSSQDLDQNQNQSQKTKTNIVSFKGGSMTQRTKQSTNYGGVSQTEHNSNQFNSVMELDQEESSFLQSVPLACRQKHGDNGQLKTEEDIKLYSQVQKNQNLYKNEKYQQIKQNFQNKMSSPDNRYQNNNQFLPQINSKYSEYENNKNNQYNQNSQNYQQYGINTGKWQNRSIDYSSFNDIKQSNKQNQQYSSLNISGSGHGQNNNNNDQFSKYSNIRQRNSRSIDLTMKNFIRNNDNNRKFVKQQRNRHNIRSLERKDDLQDLIVNSIVKKNSQKSQKEEELQQQNKEAIQLQTIGQLDINLDLETQQTGHTETRKENNQLENSNQMVQNQDENENLSVKNNMIQESKEFGSPQDQQQKAALQQKYVQDKQQQEKQQWQQKTQQFQKYQTPKKASLEICYEKGFRFSQLQKDLNIFKEDKKETGNIQNQQMQLQPSQKKKSVIYSQQSNQKIQQDNQQIDLQVNQDSEMDEGDEEGEEDEHVRESKLFKEKNVKEFFKNGEKNEEDQKYIRNILYSDQKERKSKFIE